MDEPGHDHHHGHDHGHAHGHRTVDPSILAGAVPVADGNHARIDGLTSLAVLVGAFGVWLGYPRADPSSACSRRHEYCRVPSGPTEMWGGVLSA